MGFFSFFRELATKISAKIDDIFCINQFKYDGIKIIKSNGLFASTEILLEEIVSWERHFEMLFDVFQIKLGNGDTVVWVGKSDFLFSTLSTVLPNKNVAKD